MQLQQNDFFIQIKFNYHSQNVGEMSSVFLAIGYMSTFVLNFSVYLHIKFFHLSTQQR